MTAIKIKGAASQRKPKTSFLEVFIHSLIIVCTLLTVVLSSIAVCDGHWLQAGRQMFGLWHFCTVEEGRKAAVFWGEGHLPNCTTQLGLAGVEGLTTGLGLCRAVVSLAVVSAIFGLELLVMSQVSENQHSGRRWRLGYALVFIAFAFSACGVLIFVSLLWAHTSPFGFTLTFWCQFTSVFLFFLNSMAAHHVHRLSLPPTGALGKYYT